MSRDDEIILKRSGKRARLEITLDDLDDAPTETLPGVTTSPRRLSTRSSTTSAPARGGSPPRGFPPTRYIHGEDVPWWRTRRSAWIAGGLLGLLVVVVAALLVINAGADPEEVAYEQLSTTRAVVVSSMDQAGEATKLVALREAGRAAGASVDELAEPEATVRDLDDPTVRSAAVDVVAAERRYLLALERLEGVDRALVGERSAAGWQKIRRQIADAQRELSAAAERLGVLGFPGGGAKARVSDVAMDEVLQNVTGTVEGARERLREYRRAVAAYDRAVARARAKERGINDYRRAVARALDAYQADRTKVDGFVATADEIRLGESAARAYADVRGFVADREATVRQLANFLAQAPESVRSSHKNLEVPIQDSLEGLRALETAIYEYENDPYTGTVFQSVTETPGWASFERASDDADTSITQTRGAWEAAVTDAVKDVKDRGDIPKRPAAPQL